MNKKIKTTLFLTALTMGTLHVINRIQYSISIGKELLTVPENKYYEWRFGKIRYIKKGTGNPVLLLHDLTIGSSAYEYSKIIDELSKTHEVYCIDLLGYGLSDKPNITYTNYFYVQLITDFIRNMIGKKTDVVATGDAFPIAVMTCHNDNETIGKLIAINPQNLFQLNQIPSKQTRILKVLLNTPVIGTFIYNMQTNREAFEKTFREKYFYNPNRITQKDILSYVEAAHMVDYHSKHAQASYVGKYTNANILHALTKIQNPVYILAGKEKEDIQTIADNYTYYNNQAEHFFIPKTKQLPHLESPGEVLSVLKQILL